MWIHWFGLLVVIFLDHFDWLSHGRRILCVVRVWCWMRVIACRKHHFIRLWQETHVVFLRASIYDDMLLLFCGFLSVFYFFELFCKYLFDCSIAFSLAFSWSKTSPAAVQLLEAAKVKKGSSESNRAKVGSVSWEQIKKIAEDKMVDLNAFKIESAMKMIAGTARSMGLNVTGNLPNKT